MLKTILVTYMIDKTVGHTFAYHVPWILTESFIRDLVDAIQAKYDLPQKPVIVTIKRLWW